MQKAEFGMDTLRVTQGPYGKHSHGARPAIDFGGANYGAAGAIDKWYARGCDWKVMFVQQGGDHFVYFQTTGPVLRADGTVGYVTLALAHQDAVTHKVGDIIKDGAPLYTEGTYSGGRRGAVDPHIHAQAGNGKYAGALGGYPYKLPNEAELWKMLSVPENVKIAAAGGVAWVRSSAVPAAPTTTKEDDNMYRLYEVTFASKSYENAKAEFDKLVAAGGRPGFDFASSDGQYRVGTVLRATATAEPLFKDMATNRFIG